MKTCRKCGKPKPEANYARLSAGVFRGACRDCENADRRRRHAAQKGDAPTAPPPTSPVLREPPAPLTQDGLETVLIIPDCHVPNHDERAWGLMLRAAHILRPSTIILLGDFADGECLSAHPATKPGGDDFAAEVEGIQRALDQLDQVGAATKVYCEGNHEFRLDRYLMQRAPAMFRSIQWRNVLELHRRGWQWVPYRKAFALGKLHVTHDTGSAGVNAHRQAAVDTGGSVVIGHTHRLAYEVRGRYGGTPYLAAMLGWLGDAEKAASYIHEARAASAWAHGFGVAYLEPQSGVVHLQPVPIVNGRCVVQGRLVS